MGDVPGGALGQLPQGRPGGFVAAAQEVVAKLVEEQANAGHNRVAVPALRQHADRWIVEQLGNGRDAVANAGPAVFICHSTFFPGWVVFYRTDLFLQMAVATGKQGKRLGEKTARGQSVCAAKVPLFVFRTIGNRAAIAVAARRARWSRAQPGPV